MTPEQSTEELSDFELTQRLRAARGQEPLPDPDSLEAKLRAGADAMIEDHRNHGHMRGTDYSRVLIDDPIATPPLVPFVPDKKELDHIRKRWRRAGPVTLDYLHTTKMPVRYTAKPIRYTGGMAGGTITGRLPGWTGKK